jgi:hypothetical protein
VPDILRRFLKLHRAPDKQVELFIVAYGPLWLSEKALPVASRSKIADAFPCELCDWYRWYAKLAAAVLRTAVVLRESQRGDGVLVYTADVQVIGKAWAYIADHSEESRFGHPAMTFARIPWWDDVAKQASERTLIQFRGEATARELQYLVTGPVNWWLDASLARPYLAWQTRGWSPLVRRGNAWGAIGRALLAAITRDAKAKLCERCGDPVMRRRLRRARVWCDKLACRREGERVKRAIRRSNRRLA